MHTMTVTKIADDQNDEAEYAIGGEHDYQCAAYQECLKSWHRHPKNDEIVGDEWGNPRVGFHTYIDGMWMLPMDRCGLDLSFESYGNPEFQMFEIGVYVVDVEWDGDNWNASLAKQVSL